MYTDNAENLCVVLFFKENYLLLKYACIYEVVYACFMSSMYNISLNISAFYFDICNHILSILEKNIQITRNIQSKISAIMTYMQ